MLYKRTYKDFVEFKFFKFFLQALKKENSWFWSKFFFVALSFETWLISKNILSEIKLVKTRVYFFEFLK